MQSLDDHFKMVVHTWKSSTVTSKSMGSHTKTNLEYTKQLIIDSFLISVLPNMAKVMVMELLILFMFWSVLSNSTYALAAVSVAKEGCQDKCGNVNSIPYPFGIGKDCFLKPWFEIECKNTSGSSDPRPFLKKVNLEVLEILLPHGKDPRPAGFVRVSNPVLSSGCQGSRPAGEAVNLRGSTFVFSRERNWFTAVGCDSKATLTLPTTDPQFVGVDKCLAGCSRNKSSSTCCRSAIPLSLNAFNVTFNGTMARDNCTYAFLADKDWLRTNSCVSDTKDLDHVPAVLEWSVLDYHIPGLLEKERSIGFYFSCGTDLNQKGNQTLRCYCDNGYEGNPYLNRPCTDIDECQDPSIRCNGTSTCENLRGYYRCITEKSHVSLIKGLGLGLGMLTLAAGIWWSYKLIKKRNKVKRKKHLFKRNGGLVLQQQLASSQGNVDKTNVFTSKELSRATDRFNANRVLGQGGQGTVYKGMLPDGRIVAVKKSKIGNEGEIEPFINEVVILSQINHRNIVKLLGCCLETEVPLLVYEFVPNGNLSEYLHDQDEEFQVSWKMRLQIATQVAGALSYLHSSASIPIYHRDIKSSNILLDDKFRAKIADFGTSRSVNVDQTHLTTLVHGTCGYLDPEYFQSSQYTDKSDVYSFGVVLVELLTGQRAISTARSREGRSLATYFIITMERNELFDILDTKVVGQGDIGEIVAVANVAKRCLNLNGRNRPSMREVTKELERIGSPEKGFSGEGSYEEVEFVLAQEIEPWDAVSSPTTSQVNCISPRSLPHQPHSLAYQPLLRLPTQTW